MVYRPKEQAAAEANGDGEDPEGDEQEVSAEDQEENAKTQADAIVNQVLETQDSRIDDDVEADAIDEQQAEDVKGGK